MLKVIRGTPVIYEGDTFYSVYFDENDPSSSSDVKILEHESWSTLDQEEFDKTTGNWFLKKKDAEKAREIVCKVLRLAIEEAK